MTAHDCESCPDCLHDGHRCCGCYDGACCKETPAILYKPVDVLTEAQAAAGGVIHLDDGDRSVWLVPVAVEEETRASRVHVGTMVESGLVDLTTGTGEPYEYESRLVTPWTTSGPHSTRRGGCA